MSQKLYPILASWTKTVLEITSRWFKFLKTTFQVFSLGCHPPKLVLPQRKVLLQTGIPRCDFCLQHRA
jgi:hypothetical protein